jgi:hypothetical protein
MHQQVPTECERATGDEEYQQKARRQRKSQ